MPRHAFGESFAGEDAEGTGHVGEHEGTLFVKRGEEGDAGKAGTLRDSLERRQFFGGLIGRSG